MIDDSSISQIFPFKGEVPLFFVVFPYIFFQIINRNLLDKDVPHLIVGTLIENLMNNFIFFHLQIPFPGHSPLSFSLPVLFPYKTSA